MAPGGGEPQAKRMKGDGEGDGEPLVAGVRPFLVERFFAKHEFTAEFMLGSSDAESMTVKDLLELAKSRGDEAAQKEWEELSLGYTESPGDPKLREAIAKLYGGPVGPEQVLCAVPEEGIFMTMSALLSPGDVVVAMTPAYQSLYEIARAKGCQIKKWAAKYTAGFGWSYQLADLRSALDGNSRGQVRMVVANFPHNPTSWMPSPSEHSELVAECRKRNVLLFSDEMYWGMATAVGGPETQSSCVRYERAITLSGLSKAYGLPGLRVGWLATQDTEVMAKLKQMKDYLTICGSAPSEALANIALRHGDALLQRALATTRRNRELLQAFCKEFPGIFEWAPEPHEGLTKFVVLQGWAAKMGSQGFADWCVQEASCVFVPSDCFEFPDPPAVRFGIGRTNFAQALDRLRSHLRKVQSSEVPAAPV